MGKNSLELLWRIKKEQSILKFTLFVEKEKSALVFEAVPIIQGKPKWENEIAVGLDVEEIGKILNYVQSKEPSGPVSFTHELERKGLKTDQKVTVLGLKTLSFEMSGKGSADIKLKVQVNKQEIRNVLLNLHQTDLMMLEILLRESIKRIMGF